MSSRTLLFLPLLLTACAPAPVLEAGFEADLTRVGGCGDATLFATDEGDTVMLELRADGVVAAAIAACEATTTVYGLPHPDVSLEVKLGEHISHATCNDALEFQVVEEAAYAAVSGTATMVVTRTDTTCSEGLEAEAVLTLEDVGFEPEDSGDPVILPSLELSASVGWLPG